MIIRLTDSELEAVFTAARPLHPRDRAAFLQAMATELNTLPVVGAHTARSRSGLSRRSAPRPALFGAIFSLAVAIGIAPAAGRGD
jgi:hypothetical protein